MIWFTLAMFVVNFVLSYLLRSNPSEEAARPQKFGGLNFPRASGGEPISYIFGRVRLEAPSVMYYGGFSSEPIKEDDQVIGYQYYLTFQLGLCLGPGVVLKAIWVEDRQVYTSGIGIPGDSTFTIDKPNFFGGAKKGGGFSGSVGFYAGNNTQIQDTFLVSQIGSNVPSYPGICNLVFRGFNIGTQPNLRRMSATVERYPNNLGLDVGGDEHKIGDDLNPMELLYSALTEAWGGINADPADIDTASLTTAAATLLAEGNGMSFKFESANQGKDVVTEVLRQVDGIMYQDPVTGKVVVSLIRADYTVGSLPVFDESNVTLVETWTRSDWKEAPNQVRVTFTDPLRTYKPNTAMVQDQASIASRSKVKSMTSNFQGVTTGLTATKIAHRELAQHSVPLFSARLHLNRQASALRPGTPFVLNMVEYGATNTVFRIQRYDLGELVNENIVAEVLQDKFAVSTQLYSEPEATLFNNLDRAAADITDFTLMEAPYMFVQKLALSFEVDFWRPSTPKPPLDPDVDYPDSAWIWCGATRPANQERYDVVLTEDAFDVDKELALNQRAYNSQATLVTTMRKEVDIEDGVLSSAIKVTGLFPVALAAVPLRDSDAAGVRDGENWIVIGNEIMAYYTYTDNGDGTYDLETIQRALLDSKFEDHLAGDTVYFFNQREPYVNRVPRADTATVQAKLLSYTDIDAQDLTDVSATNLTFVQRYELPAPPDMVEVEAARWPLELIAFTTLDATWRERSRLEDPIAFVNDGTDTPESSTTYNARLYIDEVLQHEELAIAATTWSFTSVDGWGNARVEVEAVQGGQISYTTDDNEFFYANYPSLGSELIVNGRFESSLGTGWTTVAGSWAKTITAAPFRQAYDEANTGDNEHLAATSTNNELRQDITIGANSGLNAIFRAWKTSADATETGQVVVELLDGGASVLDSVTTPLVASEDTYRWERVEINLPLRTDAVTIRTRFISPGASQWDMVSIKANANSIDSDVFYDDLTSITGVAGAWGYRLMVSTYSGPLIRIYDSFDLSQQDVGFDPDGNLAPFHVRGIPRLLTLYDQTGNGNDLISFKTGDPRSIPMMSATGRTGFDQDTTVATGFRDTKAMSTGHPYMIARPNTFLVCGQRRTTGTAYMWNIPNFTSGGVFSSPFFRWAGLSSTAWQVYLNGTQEATGTWDGAPDSSDANVVFIDASNGNAYHNDPTTVQDTWTAADVTYPENTRLYLCGRDTNATTNQWDPDAFHEFAILDGAPDATDRATMMNFLKDYWFNT